MNLRVVEKKFNKTMTSRNTEIEAVKKCFDRVLEGGSSVSVITGSPGIGKTFLIDNIVKEYLNNNVTYVYGKFRQHDRKPFIAISEVIEQMVKHILTLPYDLLKNIKNNLIKALGSDIEIITSINPYARKLLGQHKTINIDNYEKLRYRVRKAIYQFISTVSESLFPLIIFIDDLQWADEPSLEVLEIICKDQELLNLMLIFAYRDNEIESVKKLEHINKILKVKNDYIHLQLYELTNIEIKEYLQLVFGSETKNINYLSRIIFGLTLGNPFYIKEIINIFIKEDILVYSRKEEQWAIEIDCINNLSLPSDMEQIISNKLNNQVKEDKSLLELIACFDGRVEYEILKKIINSDDVLLNNQLYKLCESAFLVKIEENYQNEKTITYGFVHDILLELIYERIDTKKRAEIHFNIAKNLIDHEDKIFIENNRLFIASQLLRSDYNLIKQENTERWIYELYFAGLEAKQTTAIEQALKIFECCESLLTYCDLKEKHNLDMKINLELGECQFICRMYQEAKERFEKLVSKYNTTENAIAIKRKYMSLYAYNGDHQKVIELGVEILKHLDIKFDIKNLKVTLLKGKLLYSNKKIEKLKNAPAITDERIMIALETLTKMILAANCLNDKIFLQVLMKISSISAKHGNSPYSPIGYSAYSHVTNNVWKDFDKAKKLEDITIELLETTDNLFTRSFVYAFVGTFTAHWSNPMEKSIEYLEKSIEESIKMGDFLFCSYTFISSIYAKYIMGMPLNEINDYIDNQLKKLQRVGNDSVKFIDYIFKYYINYLNKGVLLEENDQIKEEIGSFNNAKNLVFYAFKFKKLYLGGEIKRAYEVLENITTSIDFLKGHIMYIDLLFYSILTRLARHKDLDAVNKRRNKRLIEKYRKELKYWTDIYKGNHYSRYLLAEAEYTAVFDKEKSLGKIYNEAISFAEDQGQLQLVAIGNLLAAKHYYYNKKLSKFYAKEAVTSFRKWGAEYVAGLIEKEYSLENDIELISEEKQEKIDKNENYNQINKNIIYHLNRIEEMEEEQGFGYILDVLTKKNYADYAAVLFEKSDEMYLQYEKMNNEKSLYHKDLVNIKHVSYLSRKIIRYVARTQEEVILNKKPESGIFTKDTYIMDKDKISITCIPIKYLGVFVGIIYLEKMSEDGFHENIDQIIKSVIPSLISKRTTIKDVNLHSLFNPQNITSPLTDRELEVLKLVAEGMSNLAISKELYITLGTAKNHLSNIYSKLEVDSRIKAVIKAKELNIIKI